MLINAVIYTFPDDKGDEAERLFSELAVASRNEPGCLGYEVLRGEDGQRATFALWETWRDQAALDAHYEMEHFVRFGTNGVRPLATSRTAVKGALLS